MKKMIFIPLMAGLLALTACSTTPKAEEVCTSEWIEKRSYKAVDNIFEETESTVKTLRKIGARYAEGKSPSIFQMFSLAAKVKGLENELLRGSGIKDLKTVARLCNDSEILTDGIDNFMTRLELPDQMRSFMEGLPEYQNLIDYHLRDLQNATP